MNYCILRLVHILLFTAGCVGQTYYYYYEGDEDFGGGYGGYGDSAIAEPDYYADLGVSRAATAREIKK